MALSLNRLSSRLICACLLASLLLLASATANGTETAPRPWHLSISLSPEPSEPQQPKPILIVRVHTNISGESAAGLDTTDLERYFAAQLDSCHIEHVAVATTAIIPNLAPPNMYLLDISVDALNPATRTSWNGNSDPVFNVELSLAVKSLRSGQIFTTGERYEYDFGDRGDKLELRRRAIFNAADNLTNRFLDEWASGKYGDALPMSQAPTFLERVPWWLLLPVGIVAAVAFGYILASVLNALLRLLIALFSPHPQSSPIPVLTVPGPQSSQPVVRPVWDQELQEAFALSFETNGFDDAACQAVAAARLDEILASHASIEAKEAERVVSTKVRASELEKIAAYAISRCDLDKNDVIETLRGADGWPYRVLQEAKKLSVEVEQNG
jgi:hypothetical protein